MSNVMEMVSTLLEIYSFSSVGFSSQVGWTYGDQISETSNIVLADNKYWIETY